MADLRVLSLCSGIGGLDLAIRRAVRGARTVCYVEREAFCVAVLARAMARGWLDPAPVWSDLDTFDARAWRGAVDLVAAGFPCQPFSAAGNRRGTDDERWLWPTIARIIDDCGASAVALENVPGVVELGLAEILGDLAALGFAAEWGCLAASDVGAPHRRERFFLLAHRHGEGRGVDGGHDLLDGQRSPFGDDAHGRREAVGDADGARLPDRVDGLLVPGFPAAWPPGPADADGWYAWLAANGPPPVLRRGADGDAEVMDRVDRLRAIGNGVVPEQAAAAFAALAQRLTRNRR